MNQNFVITAVFLFAPFLLYFNASFCGFVFDDVSAVQNNKDVTNVDGTSIMSLIWNDYWGTPMSHESSHKSYRPLTVLTYRINHFLFGADPFSYHVINVILYFVVCLLVFQLYSTMTKMCFDQSPTEVFKKRFKSRSSDTHRTVQNFSTDEFYISSLAAMLFITHPIHTEAVTGVVGRAELLSSIFFILAILFYVKRTAKATMFVFLFNSLAVASKEQGITVIGVCIFIDIIIVNKLSLDEFCLELVKFVHASKQSRYKPLMFRIFLCICSAVINLSWRYYVMQGQLPHFTVFDNPAAAAVSPSRQLTFNFLLPINGWLLLLPNGLLCDWTMGTIPLIEGFDDIRNLLTVVFWFVYTVVGFRVFYQNPISRIASLSLAIMTFSFLPASNLFFTVGFVVAERVLFLPSIGFCLLISLGLWIIKTKYKCNRLSHVCALVLLFSHATKTLHRNTEWKSELTLFESALKVTKQNAKVWNNIGHVYEAEEKWEIALKYFIEATKVQPDDVGAYQNVARTYEHLGNLSAAETTYRKAKSLLPQPVPGKRYSARIPPSSLKIFVSLAELIKTERPEEANQLYLEAIQMRPSFVDAYINRGEVLVSLNRPKDALKCYEKVLHLHNANKSDIYYNIGVVHSLMGNHTGAVEAYTYSIVHNPFNVKALFNSAVIFEETREPSLLARAKSRIERILALEPDHVLAMSLLGSIHMDLNEYDKAIHLWKNVLTIEPTQRTCLFNLALIFSKMDKREDDCINAVQTLLHHYPQHEKGLQLYGDTLLNKKKDTKKAKNIYEQIIALNPTHVEAHHNLCVVMVEERDLVGAETCLMNVYTMAPHLDYVQDNLARVRRQLNLIEIGEKKEKADELANFQKTPAAPAEEFKTEHTNQVEIEETEEVIYVAKPMKKKPLTAAEEAAKIRKSLEDSSSGSVEENLKKAIDAVKKLENLQKQIDQKRMEKCSSNDVTETADLKQSALNLLDKLENQLNRSNI